MNKTELVLITSKGCSPCKVLKRKLKEDGIDYIELDSIEVDYEKFSIMSVPALFLMQDNDIVMQMTGFNIPGYKEIIQRYKTLK